MIVLLSDHGEGLMDHGEQEHGVLLYRESLQVPLIVKPAGAREHREVDSPVGLDRRHADDSRTGRLSGAAHPRTVAGRIEGHRAPIYSESLYARIHLGCGELRSIVDGERHVIDGAHAEVYDLKNDPREKTNVIDRERRAYASARSAIAQVGGAFVTPDAIDAEEAKKLAALGYVSGGSDGGASSRDPSECLGDLARLKDVGDAEGAEAIARLEAMLAANPRWSDVRDQLGAAYDDAGDHLRAARLYEDGIRATPRLAGAFALSAASSLFDAHRRRSGRARARRGDLRTGRRASAPRRDRAGAQRSRTASREAGASPRRFDRAEDMRLFLAARIAAAQHDYRARARIAESDRAARAARSANRCRADFTTPPAMRSRTSDGPPMPSANSKRRSPLIRMTCSRTPIWRCCSSCGAIAPRRCRRSSGWPPRIRAATRILFAAESLDRWGEHDAAERGKKVKREIYVVHRHIHGSAAEHDGSLIDPSKSVNWIIN